MIDWRAKLLVPLAKMDGVAIIDSDPGGYPDSSNEEFVSLLLSHRKMLNAIRPGIELYYWMHAGWLGYGRFYKNGVLVVFYRCEQTDVLARLKERNPEPWGVANGLAYAQKLGIDDRVINFNYGTNRGRAVVPHDQFWRDQCILRAEPCLLPEVSWETPRRTAFSFQIPSHSLAGQPGNQLRKPTTLDLPRT